MRMCAFRIYASEAPMPLAAADFADQIWARVRIGDQVEHVRIRAGAARLDIAILLMATSDDTARAVGARICAEALAAAPDTHGWTLQPLSSDHLNLLSRHNAPTHKHNKFT
jgi:hypothetical protein